MRRFLERAGFIAFAVFGLVIVPLTLSYTPAESMPPQNAGVIMTALQQSFYANTGGQAWTFDGFLGCENGVNPHPTSGMPDCFPNGQGSQHITDLNFTQCMSNVIRSWGQMVGLIISNTGPPYGPSQPYGGCTNGNGQPPTPKSSSQIVGCSSPDGKTHAANLTPLAAAMIQRADPTAVCYHCSQGPYWVPCWAGNPACYNPPKPGSCVPAPRNAW